MVIRIYVMMPYTLASSIKTVVLVWLDTPLFAKLIYSTVPMGITPVGCCCWLVNQSAQKCIVLSFLFFGLQNKLVNGSQFNLNLAKLRNKKCMFHFY